MTVRTITVPAGIGDASWVHSKLCHVGPLAYEVADGWPQRTVPFLESLPGVESATYAENLTYTDLLCLQQALGHEGQKWSTLKQYPRLFLEANQHLEAGKPLKDWLPDLPTDYHHPMPTPSAHDLHIVNRLLDGIPKDVSVVGVSAASYRGSKAWHTWEYAQWSQFLKQLQERTGAHILLLGGYWDDLTYSLAADGHADAVGKTSIVQAIELLRRLDYYMGFSSGLGILRAVLDKPLFMLWAEHHVGLRTSWADPLMVEDGSYGFSGWESPQEILAKVLEHITA